MSYECELLRGLGCLVNGPVTPAGVNGPVCPVKLLFGVGTNK